MSIKLDSISNPELVDLLLSGSIGVIPTDTLYGLVCLASDESAVQQLYSLKRRDKKPGTIIAANEQQLVDLGLKARYLKPVAKYWPNPISIVIPCTFDLPYLHLGVGSLAVRIVNNVPLRQLLEKTGPLLTSSANLPNEPEAPNITVAQQYFGDKVDFYVDGGDLSNALPSTVMRVIDDAIEVLRQGSVKINEKGEIIK